MNYLFAVGHVTETATHEIERVGGRVMHVSSVPSVQLVSIPSPTFEYTDYAWQLRIKKKHISLVWSGNAQGPALTTIDRTILRSECNEPHESSPLPAESEMGDINDCLF